MTGDEEQAAKPQNQPQYEAPIHGDILEAIIAHVPLIYLLPASHVSKSWNHVVSSTLRRSSKKPKPWLLVHTQNVAAPNPTTTTTKHAYDPASRVWITIHQPPSVAALSALRSSHSALLYSLSPAKFLFSFDPLHLTWHETEPPAVCRVDPVVAVVGRRVIVAGGAYEFEDDPLAVEIYDLRLGKWSKSEPMPAAFKTSASSTWISTAVTDSRLVVTEKLSGVTHYFDPETETWYGPYDLRQGRNVVRYVIGISNGRLILFGLLSESEDLVGVKVWEVSRESFECEEIGEMPADIFEKLKGDDLQFSSIEVCMAGNVAYIYKPSCGGDDQEVVVCEFGEDDGGLRWWSVNNLTANGRRLVVTCAEVRLEELQRASRLENWRFVVAESTRETR